ALALPDRLAGEEAVHPVDGPWIEPQGGQGLLQGADPLPPSAQDQDPPRPPPADHARTPFRTNPPYEAEGRAMPDRPQTRSTPSPSKTAPMGLAREARSDPANRRPTARRSLRRSAPESPPSIMGVVRICSSNQTGSASLR